MANKKSTNSRNSIAEQTAQENTSPVGPKVQAMKDRFQAKSVPLGSDFANLIDIADCGRRAIGASADQKETGPGAGLSVDDSGRLQVKEPGAGLSFHNNEQLQVSAGAGIDVTDGNVNVLIGDGLEFVPAPGGKQKIHATPQAGFFKGMIIMYSGIKKDLPDGWHLCDGDKGTPDLRNRFILGGSSFSQLSEDDDKHSDKMAPGGAYKITTENNTTTPTVNITLSKTLLTEDDLPEHFHRVPPVVDHPGDVWEDDFKATWGQYGYEDNTYPITELHPALCLGEVILQGLTTGDYETVTLRTEVAGNSSGDGHTHHVETASIDGEKHNHIVNIETPYYEVAFIMYVGE